MYHFKSLFAIYKWRNQLAEDLPDAMCLYGQVNDEDRCLGKVWVVTGTQKFLFVKGFFTSTTYRGVLQTAQHIG